MNEQRLDAAESVFFKRQLESIDQRLYGEVYPENLARQLIPTISGVDPDAPVYTWRMVKQFGQAAIVADMSESVPRSDVSGEEQSQTIKTLASSFGWSIDEIRYAARTNTPLDAMKAMSARHTIDTLMDQVLATGNTAANLKGILNLSNTTSYSPVVKSGGGLTWANATPDEIATDMFGIVSKIIDVMKASGGPMFQRFRLAVPVAQFTLISQKRMGDGSDSTILNFVKGNSPYIESISAWHRCATAGGGGTDRLLAFPPSEEVVGALVPLEFTTMPPQQENLTYKVIARAKTGGVVSRYPLAVGYGDGI